MKCFDKITDDAGQEWEILYESKYVTVVDDDGNDILDARGCPVLTTQIIGEFQYRLDAPGGSNEDAPWLSLPPWATPSADHMVGLGWFDEDDDGEIALWKVALG